MMKRLIVSSTYLYDGPVYRFGRNIGTFKIETDASSIGRAKSNILYRIKQELDLDRRCKVEIIDSHIKEVAKIDKEEIEEVEDNEKFEQLSLFDM